MKLETLVWASMYDDTVRFAEHNVATLDPSHMCAPKIEPEVGFWISAAQVAGVRDHRLRVQKLDVQPVDFVAAGLHAALIVGEPILVTFANIPTLVGQLPKFTVALARNGDVVAEGRGAMRPKRYSARRSPARRQSDQAQRAKGRSLDHGRR